MKTKNIIFLIAIFLSVKCFAQNDTLIYCNAYQYITNNKEIKDKVIDCLRLSKIKYRLFNKPITYDVAPINVPVGIGFFLNDSLLIDIALTEKDIQDFYFDISNISDKYMICKDTNGILTLFISKPMYNILLCDIQYTNIYSKYHWQTFTATMLSILLIYNDDYQINSCSMMKCIHTF
jgi:hypothetical protein